MMSDAGSIFLSMENNRVRRAQLRTLTCPGCGERGLLKTILWGMPEATFDSSKYELGGCIVPSSTPPDCRCSGCNQDCYRDLITGFIDSDEFLIDN